MTPPLLYTNFGGVPIAPDCPRWPIVGVTVSIYLKLFGREIIFEVFQPVKNIPEHHGIVIILSNALSSSVIGRLLQQPTARCCG